MPSKLVILISGNGSNLQAIIDAIASGVIADTIIALVISNRKDAYGLERARKAGIPTTYHNLVPYSKIHPSPDPSTKYSPAARAAYDADLAKKVLDARPDLVILSPSFLAPLSTANTPVINLHPALPNQYDGALAIERAYADFQAGRIQRTGLMVHYVVEEVDRGEPIVVRAVEIREGDGLEDLRGRIHGVEHGVVVEAVGIVLGERRRRDGAVDADADG
ncbi:MAG: hypothetical protein L6R42_006640 [Xanthoria sp. 1 TBL-2021]|nr:MAG: hypothetical protein L6R42_006640 [Xanthoria sp. 1 TBL-2021]